jgi:hypothetical protein
MAGISAVFLCLQLLEARKATIEAHNTTIEAHRQADQAQREADNAEKSIPRSWLYVELPKPFPTTQRTAECGEDNTDIPFSPFTCIRTTTGADKKRHFNINFTFTLHNYGAVPATIISVEAVLLQHNPNFPVTGAPLDPVGTPKKGVSFARAANMEDIFGVTIGSNGTIDAPIRSYFFIERDYPETEQFGFFPKWVLVHVKYGDPYGADRETSYLAETQLGGFHAVQDKNYTYQR